MSAGQQAIGAQFMSIGTNGCWLTELKPNGLASTSAGEVTIQVINAAGGTDATYGYYVKQQAPRNKGIGWYRGTTYIKAGVNDVFFPAGMGLWVKGKNGVTFTSSGEVLTTDFAIALKSGQQLLSNPYPTSIKLTQIVPTGLSSTSAGEVTIQVINAAGGTDATYGYYVKQQAPRNKGIGWYRGTTYIKADTNDVTFEAGKALWIKGKDGVTLTFTKPF